MRVIASTLIFLLTIIIQHCSPANILCIFPIGAYSHQQPLLALSHALARKGHNLTVVTANPSKTPIPNHRDVDVSFVYDYFRGGKAKEKVGMSTQERSSPFKLMKDFSNFLGFVTDDTLSSQVMQELIRETRGTKYDLLMYEAASFTSYLGFAEISGNPPIIGLNTVSTADFIDVGMGNPVNPSYIPSFLLPKGDRMDFWGRIVNLYVTLYTLYKMEWVVKPYQEYLLKKHFGRVKHSAEELDRNKSLLIVSSDLAYSYPKPLQPNTVFVGPMHVQQKPAPLPQDLKTWLDEAEDGVIYFSLGSNMQGTSVDAEKRAAFIKAFSQFPKVRVLWKWESDKKLPGQPDNVWTRKWIPQQSVLAHPKIRLFISQGGLQSFQEATTNGVPILAVPMYGDQDYNAKKIVTSGVGLSIEFLDINYETVYESLKAILTDSSFKQNMLRQSAITRDKPMPPVDAAVWWVEYVLRHNGAPHLKPASLDLTWYQYFLVDVVAGFTISLLVAYLVLYYSVKSVIKNVTFYNRKLKSS